MSDGISESIRLLDDEELARDHPDGAAAATFQAIEGNLAAARESVEIHMYVWRSDAVGNRIGEAVLAAADRGVKVRIIKDMGAFMYERIEMNRKSFFNKEISWSKRQTYRLLAPTFPNTYVEDEHGFELGERIMAHPGIELEWVNKTHTKYYVFDEQALVTGSVNIEDRHRGYFDYMVELRDAGAVARFRERQAGRAAYDPDRAIDFLCNRHGPDGEKHFEIKGEILRRIAEARESIYLEMAYIGDEDLSRAIVEAARRGVKVTFLFSAEANIGHDINLKTIHDIHRAAPVEVHLSERMLHSKLMLFDDEVVTFGSCNLSVFSLQKAGELNLVVRDHPEFLRSLREVIDRRLATSRRVGSADELRGFKPLIAALQQLHQKWNPN